MRSELIKIMGLALLIQSCSYNIGKTGVRSNRPKKTLTFVSFRIR